MSRRRVRDRLSYANVVATGSLFVALGGVAWALESNGVRSQHIAPDAARGADVKESTLSGIGTGVIGGEATLGVGTGSQFVSPIGPTEEPAQDANTLLAPRELIATGFRVELEGGNLSGGERRFVFLRNGEETVLRCSVSGIKTGCRSNRRLRFEKGDVIGMVEHHTVVVGGSHAAFGWIAQTP